MQSDAKDVQDTEHEKRDAHMEMCEVRPGLADGTAKRVHSKITIPTKIRYCEMCRGVHKMELRNGYWRCDD